MDLKRDGNFLLSTDTAAELYHAHAQVMPIVDYHCHLSPEEIATDKRFSNITELWLGGDHYKWRLMRALGYEERFVTGDADPRDKFRAFADTLAHAIGNPMYHWSRLELARYFDYDGPVRKETADEIYAHCNERLRNAQMSARGLITSSNVTHLCTTDDPVDDLHWHREIAADASFATKVFPAWRPDAVLHMEKEGFVEYLKKLSDASGIEVHDLSSLKEALSRRLDHFAKNGCTVSDHGLDFVPCRPVTDDQADAILKKRLAGEAVTQEEVYGYLYVVLSFLAEEYAHRNWVMQLHFGVQRNLNPELFRTLGADVGADAIGVAQPPEELAGFLHGLQERGALPKTILYSLNPTEDVMIETIMGCFQGDGIRGKLQHGSAWWFNDHEQGMRDQISHLAAEGMLATFVGMLTDSRSFLSYARHEYFRRILCDLIGGWAESGRIEGDGTFLGRIVEDISYHNAVRYFGWD